MTAKTTESTTPLSDLSAGVTLLRTFKGHVNQICRLAIDHLGRTLASGSVDGTIKLWDVTSGSLLRTLEEHADIKRTGSGVYGLAFAEDLALAGGSVDRPIQLWDIATGARLRRLGRQESRGTYALALDHTRQLLVSGGQQGRINVWDAASGVLTGSYGAHGDVYSLVFAPHSDVIVSGDRGGAIQFWTPSEDKLLETIVEHSDAVLDLSFSFHGNLLASSSADRTVKIWEWPSGRLTRTLEEHSGRVEAVAFSADSRLLASKGADGTIRIWNCKTWEPVAMIPEPIAIAPDWIPALIFHPTLPLLVSAGFERPRKEDMGAPCIHLWKLDLDVLLEKRAVICTAGPPVHHTTGKIVLLGDHGVGKSALGYRLIHGHFKEQKSTHGQQFWVFPALGTKRADGTECEAILWDFAGQPDYRLVHALSVDNADLALVLFDASDLRDPLHGVGFWLNQLQAGQSYCPVILVAAQTDRGTCPLTPEELQAFCERSGIVGPIATSSATGAGIDELIERMKSLIPWDKKDATSTSTSFKRIKDYILGLKEGTPDVHAIVTVEELRGSLQKLDAEWKFTHDDMLTAVNNLGNYGYVRRLRTSMGQQRVLLEPERLNNLASSFVLEARRNVKGLGALEEKRLLSGSYDFPELKDLNEEDRDVLLDAAVLLFLEHKVCFRETDPLSMERYLVFPELINLKKPLDQEPATQEDASYIVSGKTENVFASLVVLLGYTEKFTRTAQWQNNARYEVSDGLVCGFRQKVEHDGELDFVLCFGTNVGEPVRKLFQGLFESFLAMRKLTVMRLEAVRCSNTKCLRQLERAVVRQRLKESESFTFCNACGEKLMLRAMEPIQLKRDVQSEVESAKRRTVFEQAVFRLCSYISEYKIHPPECFISYAWGVAEHERWVQKRLVPDLQNAGISVVFDRRENQIGDSLTRFVSRIPDCDSVVVVGTPLYFQKFQNRLSSTGSIVAAEVDLISQRLVGTEDEKRTVKTLLLAGEKATSLPPLMRDRVHADFRDDSNYFAAAFDLIASLYKLAPSHPAVADLREQIGMVMAVGMR